MTNEELETTNRLRLQRDQKAARIEELEAALAAEQKVAQIAEGRNFDLSLEVPKLEAALAEARKDGKRLDWLERQTSFVWPRWEPTSANPDCDWAWFTAAHKAGPFETMREAIDAARGKPAKPLP